MYDVCQISNIENFGMLIKMLIFSDVIAHDLYGVSTIFTEHHQMPTFNFDSNEMRRLMRNVGVSS
jgi:hypothetical protein